LSYPVDQPTTLTMGLGFMSTIGIVVNNDRCAIVSPMAYEGTATDENALAASLNDAIVAGILPQLLPLLSSDAYVSYVQAEGMWHLHVPDRVDFAPTDQPGTGSSGAMPSTVGGLLYFIMDARDAGFTRKKIAQGKNFIPGIPRSEVTGDKISTTWQNLGTAFTNQMQKGINAAVVEPSLKWWRMLAKPTSPPFPDPVTEATAISRVFANGSRGYVVTQRRRVIPR